ncbi:MAG TPA: hypothetical protein EYG86_06630 [Crocinitomicaceae bacterium]|nr:hypothetical protein [Crocinitomicaceae bacterium]
MKLHLIRHGKASNYIGELDFDRPLSEKGINQAKALGNFLEYKLVNNEVWCSDAVRTSETLSIIQDHVSFVKTNHRADFYLAQKEILLNQLWDNSSTNDVVIVGHNFGLSDLLNYFTDELILMQTGEYICIDFGELTLRESSKNTGVICDQFRFTP